MTERAVEREEICGCEGKEVDGRGEIRVRRDVVHQWQRHWFLKNFQQETVIKAFLRRTAVRGSSAAKMPQRMKGPMGTTDVRREAGTRARARERAEGDGKKEGGPKKQQQLSKDCQNCLAAGLPGAQQSWACAVLVQAQIVAQWGPERPRMALQQVS